ncbi:MAG: alpha/beta fold hydrolase [Bacteroidetes bacterium]|nr:alpha/beta fold hydrolase [Bacteroidota bacterium]MBL0074362.1 alpha/beta fold hydrolase [Bacteroidota bacterium]
MIKRLLFALIFVLGYQASIAQNNFECHCSEIGIDSLWANENAINCFKIPVNLIYNDARKGRKIIAVMRAKSTENSKFKPLLYLHGGPGIATLENAQRYLDNKNWKQLRKNHDIVMMDYSGTGYSEPFLCESILDSISKIEKSSLSKMEKKEKTIILTMDCRDSLKHNNIDINTFTSFQMAADADAVRKTLNIDKWQVYGVSYGTLVALLTARHFPENIESIVLDSPFPPNAPYFDYVSTMNETLQHMQNRISSDPKTASQFQNIISDFTKTSERLNKRPVKIHGNDFTGEDFAWAMLMTFYQTKTVKLIPLALSEFAAGNDTLLRKWLDGLHSENQYGKPNEFHNKAITCFECKPRNYDETPQALERKFPHLKSLSMKDFMEICNVFRPEHPDASFYDPIESDIPILVLSGEFDPGTPTSFGHATMKKLSKATFVIVPNASHAAMHYNECTAMLAEKFLENSNTPINTNCINEIEKIKFVTSDLNGELDKILMKE